MKETRSSSIKAASTLFLLAPVISELLFGATPWSRIHLLFMASLLYGAGAVLVREIVRRSRSGWISAILFGVAFGVIRECILLQSVFNPDFVGLDITFGRRWGVNWAWAEYIIGYHTLWSIAIPMVITEIIYPQKKPVPWLNVIGLILMIVIFLIGCIVHYRFFDDMEHYHAPTRYLLLSIFIAAALIITAYLLKNRNESVQSLRLSGWKAGVIACLCSVGWLVCLGLVFTKGSGLALWFMESAGPCLILLFLLLIRPKYYLNDGHLFFIISGCLIASMSFGMYVLTQTRKLPDIAGHIVFVASTAIFLIVVYRKRIYRETLSENKFFNPR